MTQQTQRRSPPTRKSASQRAHQAAHRLRLWYGGMDIDLANGNVTRKRAFQMWVDQDPDPVLSYSQAKRIVLQMQTSGWLRAWRGAASAADPTLPLFLI